MSTSVSRGLNSGLEKWKRWTAFGSAVTAATLMTGQQALTQDRPEEFKGKIGRTFKDSVPHWPELPKAPKGAPNVLIWLLDDAGFAQIGSFGGLIETRTIDRLAARGLRYNNFHTTALCSPSRASILTGRNHHAVGMGSHVVLAAGFPGYYGRIPKSAATVAKILKQNGYRTFALGKWDLTPSEEVSIVGPFDRWPTGLGFDHYYGFMSPDTNNFHPLMWENHKPMDPAVGNPDYHVSTDMADEAVKWITALKSASPERPFFMYWATGAVHAPHHAPKKFIEKYKGKFDMGWDRAREIIFENQKKMGVVPPDSVLSPRPEEIKAWNSLKENEKRLFAHAMEVFAAQLDHADFEFGRILDALERIGELENTLVIVTSDNGASAEGGPAGSYSELCFVNGIVSSVEDNERYYGDWGGPNVYNHYPSGWALAGNTPFKYYKGTTHRGGVHDPLVVSWPRGIASKGEIRSQYHHINDIMPTILEVVGIPAPDRVDGVKQQRIDGISMKYSFNDRAAPNRKKVQYYEMFGNRGIWADGWKAVVLHKRKTWELLSKQQDYADDVWELYHVDKDFSESNDLARQDPKKVEELKALFEQEAKNNNVFPLVEPTPHRGGVSQADAALENRPIRYVYYLPGAHRIPEVVAPPVKNRSHSIMAEVEIPQGGVEGVIVAQGGNTGGYALYVQDNQLIYSYNFLAETRYTLRAKEPMPAGKSTVRLSFTKTGEYKGHATLLVNDKEVGEGDIARTIPVIFSMETFDVGRDNGTPVNSDYKVPFTFTGKMEKLVVELGPSK